VQVTFRPDAGVFAAGVAFDPDIIIARLRELSYLNAGEAAAAAAAAKTVAHLQLLCSSQQWQR
jgi:DNA gyrase/topoisomerase IV subunit B